MKNEAIIVDADFCIKLGRIEKQPYLKNVLTALADKIYVHQIVYDEIMTPAYAKEQINDLIQQGKLEIVSETSLGKDEEKVYFATQSKLKSVMENPNHPRKNQGEIASLAMAKTKSIPYFCTDENDLQTIIDANLNTGLCDILCIRIEDLVKYIKEGTLDGFKRKDAKLMWTLSGKHPNIFDSTIWPKA
ncbi:MAG: hypothetical protein IJA90_11510 [Peptococcaceae bacterium]|nr:hypothetical protein [Peptococcaceae bacterium]